MRYALLLLSCVSCAAATPATIPVTLAVPVPASAAAKAAPKPDWASLRAALDRSKVTGFALVDRRVMLSPTKDVAKAGDKPSGAAYVTVLEDLGGAIRVRTKIDDKGALGELLPAYDLEGFVPRGALVPVLAHPVVKDLPDGTGYVLREGLELALGERIAPANLLLAKLPAELAPGDVTLGFGLVDAEPALAKLDGPVLGCARDGRSTRVDTPEALRKARDEQWRREHPSASVFDGPLGFAGRGYYDDDACRLVGVYDQEDDRDRKDAELKVGAASLGPASKTHLERVEARRASASEVLVTFTQPRALVRARTSESVLASRGGGGAGMLGGQPPKVWAVRGAAVAWYADGTRAGVHKGKQPTKMRGAHEANGRMCYRVPHVTTELCHDKADLIEVDDAGW